MAIGAISLTRRQSLSIGIGAIALFFGLGVVMLQNDKPKATKVGSGEAAVVDSAEQVQNANLESRFTLQRFHRSEVKNGKKVWEVEADKGQYDPQTNSAKLESATVQLFKDDGIVTMKAPKAILYLDGTALKSATASDGVVITYDDKLKIETNSATYDKVNNSVTSDDFVKITSESMEISGTGLSADTITKEFTLKKNIETIIKGRPK